MQFIHPTLLWALFLLSIPVIIHLFQLRRFQKEAFTNVALLKKMELQTRKSSRLKKWLIFSTRTLALTALIVAFAQPYYAAKTASATKKELAIYLDNSWSMQAKSDRGELLRKSAQELIETVPEETLFTLFTNDNIFRKTTIASIRNELLTLNYSPYQLTVNDAVLKGKKEFSDKNSAENHLLLLSDFQQHNTKINIPKDTLLRVSMVKATPQKTSNVAIDSLYIAEKTPDGFKLTATLIQQENNTATIPVSLFNNEKLIAKTSAAFNNTRETAVSFDISSDRLIKGKITIEEDEGLSFDNALYFTINPQEKIQALTINEADDDFLKRIYIEEEFTLTSTTLQTLNYSAIPNQNLIVLNELKNIPNTLIAALQAFKNQGGTILIITSKELSYPSYNQLLKVLNIGKLNHEIFQEKKILFIKYAHPLFKNVFEKQIQNFQYPNVKSYYTFEGNALPILQLENNAPFLVEKNNNYLFTAPLTTTYSNFQNSPLIVPVFYTIGKNSLTLPQLYYTIGNENEFDVKTTLQKDKILTLSNNTTTFIPKQQAFDTKVKLSTYENPSEAGNYDIKSGEIPISYVSFNDNRNESNLTYYNVDTLKNVATYTSIPQLFTKIKNENTITALWKWFVIFALLLLLIELLLLKLFK